MPFFKDYTGMRIGRVNIISLNSMCVKGGSSTKWNCICDCGNKFIGRRDGFKKGNTFECKRCVFERRRGIDLTGRKFGRWTVLKIGTDKRGKTNWYCKCDCGNEGWVDGSALGKSGKSESCGCLGRKRKSVHVNTTLYPPSHGLSTSKFYAVKTALIHKCYKETNVSYKNFGAKGISVCDLWRNGAKDMYNWAMENGWNNGDVICLKEGEKEFNPQSVYILKEDEFRSEIALTFGNQITYNGETHSVRKWAELMNVNQQALRKRLKNCPSIEEAFNSEFKKHIFNEKIVKECIDLYESGEKQCVIARKIGCSPATLTYHLLKNGVQIRKDDNKRNKLDHIKNEEIIKLTNEGFSPYQISKKLGCSEPTIKHRIEKIHGIKRIRKIKNERDST